LATLQLILVVGVLLYSLYSMVTYSARRRENKRAFEGMRQDVVVRDATAEELAAIQPFLFDPARPNKAITLAGKGVHQLRGEFIRHGISTQNGGDQMHDTIGGVDVVLPYDAAAFLLPENDAEVLLTDKHAIVISLNGLFDVVAAQARDRVNQAEAAQWARGERGRIGGAAPEEVDEDGEREAADAGPALDVEILGQRTETAEEVAARNSPGIGGLALLCALPGIGLALYGASGELSDVLVFGGAGLAMIALGLWFGWRPAARRVAGAVNRARGVLTLVTVSSASNSNVSSSVLYLGQSVRLTMPDHWLAAPELTRGEPVDVDVRVEDNAVLRLGRRLSIADEERKAPTVFWGRHLGMALLGLCMACASAYLLSRPVMDDTAHALSWLRGRGEVLRYDSAEALMAQPPEVGQIITVAAPARCRVAWGDAGGPPVIDCHHHRLGGEMMTAPELELDALLLAAQEGRLLKAGHNPMVDAMVRMELMRRGSQGMYLGGSLPQVSVLTDLTRTVADVAQLCADPGTVEAGTACSRLKGMLVDEVFDGIAWDEVLRQAQAGTLKDASGKALVTDHVLNSIRKEMTQVANALVGGRLGGAVRALLESQRGGVVLSTMSGDVASAWDWQVQWAQLRALEDEPYQVEGMVRSVSSEAPEAALVVSLDERRDVLGVPASALRAGLFWFGLALLVAHGAMFVLRLRQASARSRRVAAMATGSVSGFA
jgi:hypothetical protein